VRSLGARHIALSFLKAADAKGILDQIPGFGSGASANHSDGFLDQVGQLSKVTSCSIGPDCRQHQICTRNFWRWHASEQRKSREPCCRLRPAGQRTGRQSSRSSQESARHFNWRYLPRVRRKSSEPERKCKALHAVKTGF
jgi:hypothetical protein